MTTVMCPARWLIVAQRHPGRWRIDARRLPPPQMTQRSPFRCLQISPEIIRLTDMLYIGFPPGLGARTTAAAMTCQGRHEEDDQRTRPSKHDSTRLTPDSGQRHVQPSEDGCAGPLTQNWIETERRER